MAGYLIAAVAFAVPLGFGLTGLGRGRIVLGVGAVLALGAVVALAASGGQDVAARGVVPLWLTAGLVVLLYVIWCGGLWLGLRVRRARSRA